MKKAPITRDSSEVCEVFRDNFFLEHLWTTALGCLLLWNKTLAIYFRGNHAAFNLTTLNKKKDLIVARV